MGCHGNNTKKGRITDDAYDKYFQSFQEQKADIATRLGMLQEAEDNYYISAQYLLELATRASKLFESSKVEERRQLIKLTLSNLRVEDGKVQYEAIKPFDTILNYADRQAWLRTVNDVRIIFERQKEYIYIPDLRAYANA